MLRTHTCGELRKAHADETVTLCGWVKSIRHHGKFFFIDLRDRYGTTQIIADESFEDLEDVSTDSVILVRGTVQIKPEPNPELNTGEIEVSAEHWEPITEAKPLPIDEKATPQTKLKYRYIDLRKNPEKIMFRHRFVQAVRRYFNEHDFVDIETPLLMKATPEGARDYIVPSRVHHGKAYALPQSPQLYKQLLMVAGFDKYYQIAKCLRDEDLRADRQPEFTQIDYEMSFVEQEDVLDFTENLMKYAFKETLDISLDDFPRLTHKEAMAKYGSDKPDTRFGYELRDVTSLAQRSDFRIFQANEYTGAIAVDHVFSRSEINDLEGIAKDNGAKGLAYVRYENGETNGSVANFIDTHEFKNRVALQDNGTVFFVSGKKRVSQEALGAVRLGIRDQLDLVDREEFNFVWVTDFPLFEWDEDQQRWLPEHHVFTMPHQEHVETFHEHPETALSQSYDLAMNGIELGSGSIRVTNPELQQDLLDFIGIGEEEAQEKFGFLLEAYEYGAPIHGGMALGLDRICALLTGKNDIREVIAFPKNKKAESPLDTSPTDVPSEVLAELGLTKLD